MFVSFIDKNEILCEQSEHYTYAFDLNATLNEMMPFKRNVQRGAPTVH